MITVKRMEGILGPLFDFFYFTGPDDRVIYFIKSGEFKLKRFHKVTK